MSTPPPLPPSAGAPPRKKLRAGNVVAIAAVAVFLVLAAIYSKYANYYIHHVFEPERQSTLARNAYNDGDYETAAKYYSEAIKKKPEDARFWVNRAAAYFYLKKYEWCISDCVEALKLTPRNQYAFFWRGRAEFSLGRQKEAMADFDAALAINPQYPQPYLERGRLWRRMGKLENALADFQQYTRLHPHDRYGFYLLGCTQNDLNQGDAAIVSLEESLRLDPRYTSSHTKLGQIYAGRKELTKAYEEYTRAIECSPDAFGPRRLRAALCLQMKNPQRAITDYEKLIVMDPDAGEGYERLAWIYATWAGDGVRDGAKAVTMAMRACEREAWDDAFYFDTMAAAQAEAGNFKEAVAYEELGLKMLRADAKGDDSEYNASDEELSDMEKRLTLYRGGKPYREEPE